MLITYERIIPERIKTTSINFSFEGKSFDKRKAPTIEPKNINKNSMSEKILILLPGFLKRNII